MSASLAASSFVISSTAACSSSFAAIRSRYAFSTAAVVAPVNSSGNVGKEVNQDASCAIISAMSAAVSVAPTSPPAETIAICSVAVIVPSTSPSAWTPPSEVAEMVASIEP